MSEQIVGWRATGEVRLPKRHEAYFDIDGSGDVSVATEDWALVANSTTRRIAAPVFVGEEDAASGMNERIRNLGTTMNALRQEHDLRLAALERATRTGERSDGLPTSPWRKCPWCGAEWDASTGFSEMCTCHAKPKAIPAPSPFTVHVSTSATAKVEAGESYGVRVAKIMLPQAGLIVHPTNHDLVALTTDDAVSRDNARAILGHALNAARADGLAARTVPSRERIEKLATRWQYKAQASRDESSRIRSVLKQPCDAEERCVVRASVWDDCAANLLALLTPEPPHA